MLNTRHPAKFTTNTSQQLGLMPRIRHDDGQQDMAINSTKKQTRTVADFFAGIGLVSMGLENAGWKTIYALDYGAEKAKAYIKQFGPNNYFVKDIAEEEGKNVPDTTLAHASFPCTDLSVAGARRGIHKGESSAFWHFVRIISEMKKQHGDGRPPLILLENVEGLLTSADGGDLKAVLETLNRMGYMVDLLRVDASHFVPQSRVRIFVVGIHHTVAKNNRIDSIDQKNNLSCTNARTQKIIDYVEKHSDIDWYFHKLPQLPERTVDFEDIIDKNAAWWPESKSIFIYNQLHHYQKKIIDQKLLINKYYYFPAFRRTREREGKRQSTVEFRTDGMAGCLRTPKGGSARQFIIRVGRGMMSVRLINEIEAARLMGATDFKIDPSLSLNQVLFGFGDAVCVPAVEWIAKHYLNKLRV